jgi:hypothetical protein
MSIVFYKNTAIGGRGDKLDPSEFSQIDSSAFSMGAVMQSLLICVSVGFYNGCSFAKTCQRA